MLAITPATNVPWPSPVAHKEISHKTTDNVCQHGTFQTTNSNRLLLQALDIESVPPYCLPLTAHAVLVLLLGLDTPALSQTGSLSPTRHPSLSSNTTSHHPEIL